MNKDAFLSKLRGGLGDLPKSEVDEIISDYAAHFAESDQRGRNEAEVVSALGDPARILREIRAELGLKRLETQWSLSNLLRAASALLGLAIVDLFFLLPLLLMAFLLIAAFAAALIAVGVAGVKVFVMAISVAPRESMTILLGHICIGAGLISTFLGGGASLLILLGKGVRILGNYARLHFSVVQPDGDAR